MIPLRRRLHAAVLCLILVLAGVLRLYGLRWGIPDALHPGYSFHPDEALSVIWAQWLTQGRFIAKHFIYGGTLHYTMLNAYARYGALLAPLLGGITPMANTLLFGRCFVAGLSLLTVVLTWQLGRRLFGAATGILAAGFVAIIPAHVFMAQNIRPDEAATLLSTLQVYLASFVLQGPAERDRRRFLMAGILLGISVALRFPLMIFGLAAPLAWLLRERGAGWRASAAGLLSWRIPLLAAAALLAYAASSPHSILHFDLLLQGLEVQRQYQVTTFADAIDRGPAVYQYGVPTLGCALGPPLYVLALAGVLLACVRPRPARLLLLVPALLYFVVLCFVSWVVLRYTVPLMPLLALLAAEAAVTALRRGGWPAWLTGAAVAAAVAWTVAADLAFLRVEAGRNVRQLAGDWLDAQVPVAAAIVDIQNYPDDVYESPVPPSGRRLIAFPLGAGQDVLALETGGGHDYLVISEEVYGNLERLPPGRLSRDTDQLRQVLHGGHYRLDTEIHPRPQLLGIDFSRQFEYQDYRTINPGLRIYRFVGDR